MSEYRNLDEVLQEAEKGALVVTSNTRAARNLKRAFAARQLEREVSAWPSPEILPLSAWLKRLWQEHIFRSPGQFTALLDERQERIAWERIVAAERRVLDPSLLATQCSRAWKLLNAFRIPREKAPFQRKPDTAAFFHWSMTYTLQCSKRGWMDEARLLDAVHSVAVDAVAGRTIILWGFDSFTPQQEHFLQTLRERGTDLRFAQPDGEPAEPRRISLDDARAELRAAALWSRSLLENSPDTKIGIVIPNLEEIRPSADRIFLETLHPDALLISGSDRRRSYDISLGTPLSHAPIVSTALSILSLSARSQSLEVASRILRSPFLGNQEELGARAMLDAHIRSKGVTELSLDRLEQFANDCPGCPSFAHSLRKLENSVGRLSGKLLPSAWSREILQLLTASGWPGSRTESSPEHQARRAFADLLSNFAKLDLVLEPLDFAAMVRRLSAIADESIFQPENLGAPIQLLGILEAAGSQFDHVWIMGMHATAWPPEPNPSPFLPIDLQRSHNVTGSSTAERLAYAGGVTRRLLRSSTDVVISHPEREQDIDLAISPFFADCEVLEDSALPVLETANYQRLLFASSADEPTMDEAGPVVFEPISSGGTAIFKLQAACPFRAFAELRLGAKELEMPAPGLDNRLRGGLLHKSLELVWKELSTSAELQEKAQPELEELVRRNVNLAIDQSDTALLTGWEQQVAQLERERLIVLITGLLEKEKKRPAAFRVKELELKTEVTHGGVTANVKVDRIDELEDGSLVLLDYKSGDPKVTHWGGERPDDPQLPIYAAHLGNDLAAVAFVQLSKENIQFKGYSKNENLLPSVKNYNSLTEKQRPAPTFPELLRDWQRTLERLGEEFRSGQANVDPKKKLQTCRQCHLSMVCRLKEAPLDPEGDADHE
jgi:ATP-dependent helicase/nuclease subunit B